jgi:hypothetical protein
MAEARVGEQVQVDISGLETPDVSIGGGIVATGEIVDIDSNNGEIIVRLDLSFGNKNHVTVPAERVKLLTQPNAVAAPAEAASAH